MYNVAEKLRSGEALTEKERRIHEVAACGVLRDLHDGLDRLVADAYGWPWPMDTDEILAAWSRSTTSGSRRRSAARLR